ncbi:hypothetical protein [Actinoplanes sp. NPDC026623]|uniref:hypothetical protein n=1 Tax=Actinoplanes sp. NPDC026623 TaxID=3155610 RepID=UPI003403C189
MATTSVNERRSVSWINGAGHRLVLGLFMVVVLAHWAEHLVQAFQIWGLGEPRPQARGVLGQFYPWLISSETLHYGYAIVMLIGLFALRNGFAGRARTWWTVALVIQFWHHIEHLLLLIQAQTHHFLFGAAVPTSILQHFYPRVELHLFYNTVVFIPMVVAMYFHLRPTEAERATTSCTCARELSLA